MIKQLFLYLGGILFLVSCKNNETRPSLAVNTEIIKKVNQLYTEYDSSKKSIYNQSFPVILFSPELKKTLEDAVHTSETDIERVKKSDHPDEKPLLFEGAVFSSVYEGYTEYKIKSVTVNSSGTTADVAVEFEYTLSPPKIIWTDRVRLINSGDGWKIDNINFDSTKNTKDLKASLKEFTQSVSN